MQNALEELVIELHEAWAASPITSDDHAGRILVAMFEVVKATNPEEMKAAFERGLATARVNKK